MKKIKIDFVDFWSDFDKTNNYFYNLLITKYEVIIDNNPDLIFYSCFGRNYLKYKCKRILYLGENIRPDFTACDFAFSFDYNSNKKHFRLPLYSLYIEHHTMLEKLEQRLSREQAVNEWKKKTKFCCMVISNSNCKKRIDFFQKLNKRRSVDSGGRYLNNIGGPVKDKKDFIKDYKFVLSFENSAYEGYTTEKIMEPILQHSIPIYWGNKVVERDFNNKRFLDYNNFKTEEDLINKLIEIDNNDVLGIEMIQQATFNNQKLTHKQEQEKVLNSLSSVIESKRTPVSKTVWSYIHKFKLKYPLGQKCLNMIGF